MNTFLNARPPFNFHSVVRSHGWYQLLPFEWNEERMMLGKVEQLDSGRVVLITMTHSAAPQTGIDVEIKARLRRAEVHDVIEKVAWMFALELDFEEFYALADREPRLAHCRAKAYGRLLRSSTIWEDVVKVMMTTNIQWSGTKRLIASLVNHFGETLPSDTMRRAFPLPAAVAHSRESTLRRLGLGYRSPYLLQLARGVVSGKFDLEILKDRSRPTEEVRRDLLALPGIGPYGAATLLGIWGRYDFIGVDSDAVKAVSKGFYGGRPVGEKEVLAVFERWGKYKALAYWFWDWDGQQQTPMEMWEARTAKKNG